MELSVAAALKQPGEIFSETRSETVPPQQFGGNTLTFPEPVEISFTYLFDGESIALNGSMAAKLSSRCARCDEPFIQTLTIPLRERFVKGPPGEDEESYTFAGEALNIAPMVMDNLFLNVPISGVCSEDCKGLCPVCGCNLNTAQCACIREPEEENPSPLAALGSLFDDGKEV
ncbi:MAG TPA: DUF177 domain-containing protein [Feifaniaceae bacterium]|nr:DUF177 domain-containing protein [Feifaniaceae bacterium]